MESPNPEQSVLQAMDQILGYLNFSSGNHDDVFFANLNLLFKHEAQSGASDESETTCQRALTALGDRLAVQSRENPTFRDSEQSQDVLGFVADTFLPAYKKFHQDLLFHQDDESLFNSFFIGRVFETTLSFGLDFKNGTDNVEKVLARINDFLGHRPVATLETQKIEPYAHEWIRPVPLFVRGAGVAFGKYETIVDCALKIILETDPHILRAAHFDPDRLSELSFDPRAFDFDHPINQRPNHHFGQWDEHSIDQTGHFNRFIIHQVTLDALLERVRTAGLESHSLDPSEAIAEASAVLAGTILMASGISGSGPGAFDSNTSLATLLPTIAGYRDRFYEDLMQQISDSHRNRLMEEARVKHQPYGGVRQNLNAQLAQRRASQLVNCRLASIFARMGYPEAAKNQSKIVPVASARISCQIDCLLSAANESIKFGNLDEAFEAIPSVIRRLKTGIKCGAIVDPWNIIGFDANYSLFPALENSVRDHRVYDLVDTMERIFAFCSRLWSEAAASDKGEMCQAIRTEFRGIVDWWRKFAAHEVASVDAVDAEDIFQAAELVAEALKLWHQGGAAAGDLEFWKLHAAMFDSPKAYALVIDALMQRDDYKTAMALLIHWMSQAEHILLQQGDASFHNLVFRWMS